MYWDISLITDDFKEIFNQICGLLIKKNKNNIDRADARILKI